METPASENAPTSPPAAPEPPPGLPQWVITLLVILVIGVPLIAAMEYIMPHIRGAWVIGAYAVLLLYFAGRLGHRAFFKAQSRLSELLATTFAAGLMMTALAPLAPLHDRDRPLGGWVMVVLAFVSVAWAFCGSAWGWHAARRLGETDPRKRFWLLFQGWIFTLGACGAIVSAFVLPTMASGLLQAFLAMGAFVLCLALCVPTLLTEKACRNRDKENASNPAPPPPGDKSRAPHAIGRLLAIPVTWLIGPLIVKANTWIAPKSAAAVKPLSELPGNVAKTFGDAVAELAPEGFEPVACLDYGKRTDSTSMWAMLLCDRASGEMAALSFLDTRAQKVVIVQTVAVFLSRCGERELCVTNRIDGGIFPPQPNVSAVHCPAATDLRALSRIHRAWAQREFKDAPRALPPPGEEVVYFCELDRLALDYMARIGLLYLDEKSGKFRATWRGATVLTWKGVWPWKSILHSRQRREAAELCRELGLPYPG